MALFTVNSNNVFGKTVEEAGIYNVKVLPSSELRNSNAGNPMVVLNYEVLDGKYAGGEIRFDNVVWQEGTQDKVSQSIRRFNTIMVAAGVPDGTPLNTLNDFVTGMIGKQLAIDTEWGDPTPNGRVYLTVKGYRSLLKEGSQPNGQERPQSNSNQANNGFNNGNFNDNQKQSQSQSYSDNGAPIDIDDNQLPF